LSILLRRIYSIIPSFFLLFSLENGGICILGAHAVFGCRGFFPPGSSSLFLFFPVFGAETIARHSNRDRAPALVLPGHIVVLFFFPSSSRQVSFKEIWKYSLFPRMIFSAPFLSPFLLVRIPPSFFLFAAIGFWTVPQTFFPLIQGFDKTLLPFFSF